MFVIQQGKQVISSLPAKELKNTKVLNSKLARKILETLSDEAMYPRALARKLKVNEQKIYYHIRNLEKAGVIEVSKQETVHGTMANFYALTYPAFVIKFREFEETQKLQGVETQHRGFLEPFIENGQLNAMIVVGSPDPHGPEMARSRDSYYGIDFALFLGSFLHYIPRLHVRLDTEVRQKDLENNLILIGGPVANVVARKINQKLPIFFDPKHNWAVTSKISGKRYHSDETGVIIKTKNPFNPKKSLLFIAGKRYSGTRAVIIAFLQKFDEITKGNTSNPKLMCKVVEGIDRDADGIVDDVQILE